MAPASMNQKGQAMIETIVVSSITIFFCIQLIRLGLQIRYEVIFDDLIEETLICKFQKESNCTNKLKNKLNDLHFSQIQVIDRSQDKIAKIKVVVKTGLNTSFTRESELALDLSVP